MFQLSWSIENKLVIETYRCGESLNIVYFDRPLINVNIHAKVQYLHIAGQRDAVCSTSTCWFEVRTHGLRIGGPLIAQL